MHPAVHSITCHRFQFTLYTKVIHYHKGHIYVVMEYPMIVRSTSILSQAHFTFHANFHWIEDEYVRFWWPTSKCQGYTNKFLIFVHPTLGSHKFNTLHVGCQGPFNTHLVITNFHYLCYLHVAAFKRSKIRTLFIYCIFREKSKFL